MFKCGDTVMHPGMGVCKIQEIKKQTIMKKTQEFYILKPVYENEKTTIYVPVNSDKIGLRRLLTQDDIKKILRTLPSVQSLWVDNDAKRKESFTQILKSGDHIQIMELIKELYEHKLEKQSAGKRLHISDEKILQEAERLIHQELAYTMNIKTDEVSDFILNELNKKIRLG